MNENLSTESDFKKLYETANKKYGSRVVIHGLITFMLFDLNLFAIVLFLNHYNLTVKEYLGIDSSQKPCSSGMAGFVIIPIFLLAGVLPLFYLIKQVKRARRKIDVHCPKCKTSILKWKNQNQVTQTGICPACLESLFEGKLESEQAAIEFHQKTKKESNHLVRFSGWGSLAGVLIAIPTLLWWQNSRILLGENTPSVFKIIAMVLVLFLTLPVSFWVLLKPSVSESQQFIKLFREYSNQSDTINQKLTQREPEA